ncbi:MAG: AI-2E family transporter [Cytophagales bacterium]|nr:AI-2E family transporter [Cytophagales bacterium]
MSNKIKRSDLPAVLIICTLVVVALIYLKSILIPIVIAILFAVAVEPLVRFLTKRNFNRGLASMLGVLSILVVFLSLSYIIFVQIGKLSSRQELITEKMSYYNNKIIKRVSTNELGEKLVKVYQKEITTEEYLSSIFNNASGSINASFDFLINLVLIPIYMFFFLMYPKFFLKSILKTLEAFDRTEFSEMIDSSQKALQSYFAGMAKVIGILAILNSAGLLVLGIEDAIFYGILASVLSVIPYIGIFIGSLLPAFIALITKDSAWYSVGVLAWMSLVQILEGNFITPKVIGKQININPFMVLLFLLIAGKIWGVPGLIVAIPMAAVFKEICGYVPGLKPLCMLMGTFPEEQKSQRVSSKVQLDGAA